MCEVALPCSKHSLKECVMTLMLLRTEDTSERGKSINMTKYLTEMYCACEVVHHSSLKFHGDKDKEKTMSP